MVAFEQAEPQFAHDPAEMLALEWGELGEAFTHDPTETLAFARRELAEAFERPPADTNAACAFLVVESVGAGPDAAARNRPAMLPLPIPLSWP
jgi:hypothetical protein